MYQRSIDNELIDKNVEKINYVYYIAEMFKKSIKISLGRKEGGGGRKGGSYIICVATRNAVSNMAQEREQ